MPKILQGLADSDSETGGSEKEISPVTGEGFMLDMPSFGRSSTKQEESLVHYHQEVQEDVQQKNYCQEKEEEGDGLIIDERAKKEVEAIEKSLKKRLVNRKAKVLEEKSKRKKKDLDKKKREEKKKINSIDRELVRLYISRILQDEELFE
jgi:hypothetical protein